MANTPGCLREKGIQWTNGWQDAAESIMPYIILLDNFMGPILKRGAQRKKQQSSALQPPFSVPNDLPQLGLFYADLLGERMGTAAGEGCRGKGTGGTEEKKKMVGGGCSLLCPVFVTFGSSACFLQWLARCAGMKVGGVPTAQKQLCSTFLTFPLCQCPCSQLNCTNALCIDRTDRKSVTEIKIGSDSGCNTYWTIFNTHQKM